MWKCFYLSYLRYHGHAKFEDLCLLITFTGFPGSSVVKNLLANAGNMALIPGPWRSHVTWGNKAHVPQLWSLWSRPWVCVLSHFSRVWLFATPWTVAHQAPLSMELSRQEYWSGLPLPPFPSRGSNPCLLCLLHWQAGSLLLAPPGKPWEPGSCNRWAHVPIKLLYRAHVP